MIWGGAEVIIIIDIKCTVNVICLNLPETITPCPDPQKNYLPWNPSLVQESLETTALQFSYHSLQVSCTWCTIFPLAVAGLAQAADALKMCDVQAPCSCGGSFTVLSPWSSQWCRKAEYLLKMLRPPLRARARVWILLGFTPQIFLWLQPTTVSCQESWCLTTYLGQ